MPPCDGSSHRLVTAFSRVKKLTASGPYAFALPNMESFHPPKEKWPTGTGIGTLMPIMPTVASRWLDPSHGGINLGFPTN